MTTAGIVSPRVNELVRVELDLRSAGPVPDLGLGIEGGFLAWGFARDAGFGAADGAPVGQGVHVHWRKRGLFRHVGLLDGSVPWIRIRTKRPGDRGT
jgi:hypothetical protein